MYNSAFLIHQSMKAKTDAKVLKAKIALNRTVPKKLLDVGPCTTAETVDCSPPGRTSCSWLTLPACPVRTLVAVSPSNATNPAPASTTAGTCPNTPGPTQYVLNNIPKTPLPHHNTQEDASTPFKRLEVEQITGHQSVRGRGGVITVL